MVQLPSKPLMETFMVFAISDDSSDQAAVFETDLKLLFLIIDYFVIFG